MLRVLPCDVANQHRNVKFSLNVLTVMMNYRLALLQIQSQRRRRGGRWSLGGADPEPISRAATGHLRRRTGSDSVNLQADTILPHISVHPSFHRAVMA